MGKKFYSYDDPGIKKILDDFSEEGSLPLTSRDRYTCENVTALKILATVADNATRDRIRFRRQKV